MYLNRTLCDVLEEMRGCLKSHNFSYLIGLIEEAQSMGNRMESGLGDKKNLKSMQEDISKLKQEINKLEQKKTQLRKEIKHKKA